MSGGLLVDNIVTSGQFSLDGGTWDVDNNVWIIGNATECVVIDAAHDADRILTGVGKRTVNAILCTHAHNDHINVALALKESTGAPVLLHPDDRELWNQVYPDNEPDQALRDEEVIGIGGVDLHVLHTPGHAPGAVCFYLPSQDTLFSGDTLFNGGPGATGRSYSDFGLIIDSISSKLLTLPERTRVLTGHGDPTSIEDGHHTCRSGSTEAPEPARRRSERRRRQTLGRAGRNGSAEQVGVVGVLVDPCLDERALGHHPQPAGGSHVVQRVSHQGGADPAPTERVPDLGVREGDHPVVEYMLEQPGPVVADVRLVPVEFLDLGRRHLGHRSHPLIIEFASSGA